MTREEAKNWLNKLYARADITDEYGDAEDVQPYEEAIDMAIKALEQEPILEKIRAEIEKLPTVKCTETHRIYIDAYDFKENVLAILNKYKAESEE